MANKKQTEKGIVLQEEYHIVNQAIKNLFNKPTPKEVIKKRKGRGGKEFDYVEIGYVVKKLNEIFGPFWKFEVLEKGKEEDQIWVLGRLTVYFSKDFSISKEQYGSATIKRDRETKKPLSIGDDYKAAASDALKKCASLFGIAADVYFQSEEEEEEEYFEENKTPKATIEEVEKIIELAGGEQKASESQRRAIKSLIERGDLPKETEKYLDNLTFEQAVEIIKLTYRR